MPHVHNFDDFEAAYAECMLWAEEPEEDNENWCFVNLAPETVDQIKADCATFRRSLGVMLAIDHGCDRSTYPGDVQAGHDLWLTRAGHGCGFWDGDWRKRLGDALTIRAKRLGELDVYEGDDGLIYFM